MSAREWAKVKPAELLPGDTAKIEYSDSESIGKVVFLEVFPDRVLVLFEGCEMADAVEHDYDHVYRLTWQPDPVPAAGVRKYSSY